MPERVKVMIPSKTLKRVRQAAKDCHSQNVIVSVSKGVVHFELCETKEVIKVEGVEEK